MDSNSARRRFRRRNNNSNTESSPGSTKKPQEASRRKSAHANQENPSRKITPQLNRNQERRAPLAERPIPISLNRVENLLLKEPDEIVLSILNKNFGLESYLETIRMGDELIYKLTRLLEKAFDCNSMQQKLCELAEKIKESKFFNQVIYQAVNKRQLVENTYNLQLIKSVLKLCSSLVHINPFCKQDLEPMKDRLIILIHYQINDSELTELLQEFLRLMEIAEEKNEKYKNKTFTNINTDLNAQEAPDDFTQMSVVPTLRDILTDQTPFLRKNVTNGAYQSVHHYLDVQFRLLREDFLRPLREGVGKFREIVKDSRIERMLKSNQKNTLSTDLPPELIKKLRNIESLNVYFDIKLDSSITLDHGIVHGMKLADKSKSINWESSKKLMFGSLVCFSSDFFTNECLIGIICERDLRKLQKEGLIYVRFNFDATGEACLPEVNCTYVMLETSAYFESYKHVLEALIAFQRIGELEFPFKENLIDCQNQIILAPNYLRNACIDFRPILNISKQSRIDPNTKLPTYVFNTNYAEKCYMGNKASWPTAEEMKLDESQYKAVELALENKLALIQGPPGTGKTYIGVKIVQLLLHNKHSWWNQQGKRHKPILMVCYTNHALDQFLEYCIRECNLTMGVVRVGGRSKSENLKPFLLSTIKQSLRKERKIDRNIFIRIKTERDNLDHYKLALDKLTNFIESVFRGCGIISFNRLKSYMTQTQCDQLQASKNYEFTAFDGNQRTYEDFVFLKWLGFFDIDQVVQDLETDIQNKSQNQKDIKILPKQMENLEEELKDLNLNTEELIQNEEDSDEESLNNERMLEDDLDTNRVLVDKRRIQNDLKSGKRRRISQDQEFISIDEIEELIKCNSLSIEDDEGWTKVEKGGKKSKKLVKSERYLVEMLEKASKFGNDRLAYLNLQSNVWRLDFEQRFALYLNWLEKFKEDEQKQIENLSKKYNETAVNLKELRMQEDRSIMQDALIIAMTTTGSSRYHSVLRDIGPRIVIVEEAAEVFEAHIVSSLSKHCEHLILIGDHVQLRPNPAVYNLAKDYELDVSLFERLLNNNVKKVMLSCQHRMRPEISVLMKYFYDEPIKNHESVFEFESIQGVSKNIFFLNHSNFEKKVNDSTSKVNPHEALYLAKLCEYFLKQKYSASSITILTMYLGQMMEIKKLLKQMKIQGIKVSTVDNYQGEENEIILLSLVRSNLEGRIGFVNVQNRVCVALSRARKGFYCIGNFNFICQYENKEAKKWQKIVRELQKQGSIGNSLKLTCGSHPQNDLEVSDPRHFDQRPNGGCQLPCNYRLNCGHACGEKCHLFDKQHVDYKCKKRCDKVISRCGHKCNQICSHKDDCLKCNIQVEKKITECGHLIKIACDQTPTRQMCTEPCKTILHCGHQCTKTCSNLQCETCLKIFKIRSECFHKSFINIYCYEKPWTYPTKCTKICNQELECGHLCIAECGQCNGGLVHRECQEKCDRLLFCGHKCPIPCAKQCRPCEKNCENKCPHSKCGLKCSEPCTPCKEECKYECEHFKCTKLCSELCNRPACNEPCKKILKCNHPCIGLCGEKCPPFCRICNKDIVCELLFGNEEEEDARFIYLEDCGHIIESSAMDYWIEEKYGENGANNNSILMPECPKCKTIIRLNLRYSNSIKKQLASIETIKTKQFGDIHENNRITQDLLIEINDFEKKDDLFYKKIKNLISDPGNRFSYNQISAYVNSWNIFKNLKNLSKSIQEKLIQKPNQIEHLNYEIEIIMDKIYYSKSNRIALNYGQKLNDILKELNRCQAIFKYYQFKNSLASSTFQAGSVELAKVLVALEEKLIKQINKYEGNVKETAERLFQKLEEQINLGYTEQERVMILQAIGLKQGHWFKCKCGFLYCIGECGGAMERATCPNCKREIGGQNHTLTRESTLASDFDGARYAAWSDTANNMGNWQI